MIHHPSLAIRSFSNFPPTIHEMLVLAIMIQRGTEWLIDELAYRRYKGRQIRKQIQLKQKVAARKIQKAFKRHYSFKLIEYNQAARSIQKTWRHLLYLKMKMMGKFGFLMNRIIVSPSFETVAHFCSGHSKKVETLAFVQEFTHCDCLWSSVG